MARRACRHHTLSPFCRRHCAGPLRLPIVPKPLTIAYGSAELPALVWDSRNFDTARKKAGAPGDLVAIEGVDHFTILEELRQPDGTLAKLALSLVKSS